MKLLSISRRQILRAIHVACVALFLAAAASHAQAQTYTPPFVVTPPNVTANSAGNYAGAVGFYDNVTTYNSISVGPGVTIENTSQYASPINGFYGVIAGATQSLTNAGDLSISTAADAEQAVVVLKQDAPLSFSNTGTMTTTAGADVGYVITLGETAGNSITATNSGLMTASGAAGSTAVFVTSVTGNLSFTNTSTGSVSLTAPTGSLVQAITGGAGNVSFINNGNMVSSTDGIGLQTNTGTVTSSNTGTIQVAGAGNYGIQASAAGPINLTNQGTITGTGSQYGMEALGGSSPVSLVNSGNISGFAHGLTGYTPGPLTLTNSGTITSTGAGIYASASAVASQTVVTNSGVINATSGTGISLLTVATVYDSGNITSAGNSINLANGSSLTLTSAPVINNLIRGSTSGAGDTSTLAFDLTIPAAQYASAQAQLKAEIAQYNTQSGGYLQFDIGSLVYKVDFFAANGITDGLIASRYYSQVPGFSGLGTALDSFGVNSTAVAILTALGNVSDADLPNALAELSPKSLEVFRNIAFDNNTFYVEQMNNHLANLRDGLTGFDSSALSINTSNMDPALSQIKDHLLAYNPGATPGLISDMADPVMAGVDTKDMKTAQVASTEPPTRWSTFIAGNVILANLGNSLPYQESQYTTGAVTAGADYRLDDHFTVGALFSYAHSGVDLDYLGSKANVDSYAPGIYGSFVDGGWYANGLATYVRNSYTESRVIDIPGIAGQNHGSTSGNQGTGNLTGGYEFQKGSFKFGPVATVEYVHLDIHSIDENGPTALSIDDQATDSLRSLIGFEGRYAVAVNSCYGKWLLTPHLSASWQHEYLDNSNGITSQFNNAGGGSFDTPTDQPERDSAFIDTGLDTQLNKTATVFVDYQVQAGQEDFFAQSVQGGVTIKF